MSVASLLPVQSQPRGLAPEGGTLRVVHIVQTLKSGGAETLVRTLCPRLPEHGVEVTIVSIYDDNLEPLERATLGVPVIGIKRAGRTDLGFFGALVRVLRELRADIAHCHLHSGKYAGRAAAIRAGIPVIVFTEHGDDRNDPLRFAINRVLHAKTARFITFTQAQREQLARDEGVPESRIVVIPNGVNAPSIRRQRDELRAALQIPADAFALYVPARMTAQKNQSLALRALALAAREGNCDWMLLLAGKGPDESALRAEARRLGIAERVRFLGFRSDAAELCAAMDLFLMPSRWERMPLALGEAMLVGLPVVTTPWAGISDFVVDGHTAFVARANGAEEFAAAIRHAQSDATLRRNVAERAQALARRRFDVDSTVRTHVELYRSLAAAERKRP